VDVRARAEHAIELRGEHDALDLGMLEAQALDRVGELDVDGEVVRVELELVAGPKRVIAIDRHHQRRDLAARGQPPVPIPARVRVKGRRIHGDRLSGNLVLVTAYLHALYFIRDLPRSRRLSRAFAARAPRLVAPRARRGERRIRAVPSPARDRRRQYIAA